MDYRIIGGDGQEYGPVAENTIREWIADGRLDSHSKIKAADAQDWSTVGEMPHFAVALATPAPPHARGGAGRVDIGECISVAFTLFGKHWQPLVLGALIYLAICIVFGLAFSFLSAPLQLSAQEYMKGGDVSPLPLVWQVPLHLVSMILNISLTVLFYAGGLRFVIRIVRGGEPAIADIFSAFRFRTIPVILTGLLSSFLLLVGYLFCILPGIYLHVGYIYAPLLALESNAGVWESLERSRRIVTTQWWPMFALTLLMIAFCIIGVALCGIGLLVAYPVCGLMFAKAYCDLFDRQPPATTSPAPTA